jgi:cytoskeleton protein RodZ
MKDDESSMGTTTPGALLKAAREEQGLSVVDVAARLCLSVQFIEGIERDDYSQMSARAYARGYVMSYAHLLKIPEEDIAPALNSVPMEFAPPPNTIVLDSEHAVPIYESVESPQRRSGMLLWSSIIVLIVLIGLVIMWWRGPASPVAGLKPDNTPGATDIPIQQPSTPPPSSSAAPASAPTAPSSPATAAPSAPTSPPTASAPTPAIPPPAQTQPQPTPVRPTPVTPPASASTAPSPPPSLSRSPAPSASNDVSQPSEFSNKPVALPPPRSTDE